MRNSRSLSIRIMKNLKNLWSKKMIGEKHYLQRLNLLIRKFNDSPNELIQGEYQEIITLLIKAFRENMKD